jgi:sugar O-acyltransferase (sialic acid O-acetyltransferase NeuD family)
MSTQLVIIGAGGLGREIVDIVDALNACRDPSNTIELLGFLDDGHPDESLLARRGYRVLGPVARLRDMDPEVQYVIGIGSGTARREIDELIGASSRSPATLVHPKAVLGFDVRVGPGSVICAGAVLTTNICLGRHAQVHVGVAVGHDVVLGDYVTALPQAAIAGNVALEADVTVGTGAAIIQGLRVGRGATIGAGASVVRDIPAGVTAVGVPAKPLPMP